MFTINKLKSSEQIQGDKYPAKIYKGLRVCLCFINILSCKPVKAYVVGICRNTDLIENMAEIA